MKKILIGICGIGNGHLNRQICVIEYLLHKNCDILVAVEKGREKVIKEKFPQLKIITIYIPFVACDKNGINYSLTLSKYIERNEDLFQNFLNFSISIIDYFGGNPDLVISDYEPNVARFAYSCAIPLINMEQQSKFLYLKDIKIKNFSIQEEKSRLSYFFPQYNKKIISSFFPLKVKNNDVIIVPPIIKKIKKNKVNNNLILVYFSPSMNYEEYDNLINMINKFKDLTFKIYTKENDCFAKKYKYPNLIFSSFSDDFERDMSKCSALFTTAGHQLISEAISLNIPLYVMPLPNYEQNYNAAMVKKYKLGVIEEPSLENVSSFIKNRDKFRKNSKIYKNKYFNDSWKKEIDKVIQKFECFNERN